MTLLRGGRDLDGRVRDVRLDGATVAAVDAHLVPGPDETVHDLAGFWLLPAPAEPHAHLDKALTSHRVPNATGDLAGAVVAITEIAPGFDHDDLVDRAGRAALRYLAAGATAVRTHADLGLHSGLRHVDALLQVRDALAGRMVIQVVALVSFAHSPERARAHARLLDEAIERGVDVVGGAPHMWADRGAGEDLSWAAATAHGLPLDLHTDETLDPTATGLRALARRVTDTGFDRGVVGSHCVSLGVHSPDVARATAAEVAAAGVGVIALPQTNLYLQGRQHPASTPRGLTAVRTLLDAGVTLGAGGDNLRDPFNPMGRADPTEAASLMVTAGHLTPREAWHAVSAGARRCLGLGVPELRVGAPAELLAVRADTLDDAVAGAATDRMVFHRGRLVARTVLRQDYYR